jgi:hypothetical protein
VNLSNYSNIAVMPIGAFVSSSPIDSLPLSSLFSFEPQVQSEGMIVDTLTWVKIEGCFVAEGGEQYLAVGSFVPDAQIDTIVLFNSSLSRSYYYIDDFTDMLAL